MDEWNSLLGSTERWSWRGETTTAAPNECGGASQIRQRGGAQPPIRVHMHGAHASEAARLPHGTDDTCCARSHDRCNYPTGDRPE